MKQKTMLIASLLLVCVMLLFSGCSRNIQPSPIFNDAPLQVAAPTPTNNATNTTTQNTTSTVPVTINSTINVSSNVVNTTTTSAPVTIIPTSGCTETDSGLDIYTFGITRGVVNTMTPLNYSDICTENGLKEFYCNAQSGLVSNTTEICPDGCSNGACRKASCDDSHADADPYSTGYVNYTTPYDSSTVYRDTCMGRGVIQYSCGTENGRTVVLNSTVSCGSLNNCNDGACGSGY